ncbi:MAG: TIGR00282 family metallophosphoesterase [Calditrichia bacterium]|nr:TIGR00282 family metallophosphoesterase [Calditrichota bacterium]MCB0269277.1 TIGR00282 family metallophosphoesterase [Calditrichota bacterium]MCB0286214.1 TIGR00282 family metallophosphoesterase [Calditrichota bacterium]MCB9069146.1 TIGR00282 family metallophosphoesterase [Calditrichia bacterium]
MRILFIADLVGEEAVGLVGDLIPRIRQRYKVDFTIVNGENADKGKGITVKQIKRLQEVGVDCLTSGNHIWEPRKRDVLIDFSGYLLRPLNYPPGNVGVGSHVFQAANGAKVAVMNLQGRSFMYSIDCPFRAAEKEVKRLRSETPIIFVDFHAEASAEKVALGWFLDGSVSAVVGTHTHVQTADERVLPKGCAYITDAGMSGPEDSVIGMEVQRAIERFMLTSHVYYAVAKSKIRLNGLIIDVDETTGKASHIERLNFTKEEFNNAG